MTPAAIRIFYPADPLGVVPGGIDSFIRGLIQWSPDDLAFSLVGMTTDTRQRPVGRWTEQQLGERRFAFHAAVAVADAGQRSRVPLSLRFTAAVGRHRAELSHGFDVFDFHRPEPSLVFRADPRPKVATFHNDPAVVGLGSSDMMWRMLPSAYRRMEAATVPHFSRVWCVRETGVNTLRERFPDQSAQIQFIPTWVDSSVFQPPKDAAHRQADRNAWRQKLGIGDAAPWLVSVGRLDTQKDPMLLLAAVARLMKSGQALRWLVVGDGRLRAEMERRCQEEGIADSVHFVGLQPPLRIAALLRAADLFALSSAYEGMPIALLEALGCGLPAVCTDVGEIRRLVQPERNGLICTERTPEALAAALSRGLAQAAWWRGAPAVAATAPFQPEVVLAPAYEAYRELAWPMRTLRGTVAVQQRRAQPMRRRLPVVGVPVDAIERPMALGLLLRWAQARQSRMAVFCNVHSLVEARTREKHRLVLESADLVLPDGAPVAWTLQRRQRAPQPRIDGPGTMWALCREAQQQGLRVGLYGSTPETLQALQQKLREAFPLLDLAYAEAPPFRPVSPEEDEAVCEAIRASRTQLLFIGLGCPKQEAWMADHLGRVPAVMLGVGAAFDLHAGLMPRAPSWMRRSGLEWLYRLIQEPGRLGRRYLSTNTRFIGWTLADVLRRDPVAAAQPMASRPMPGRPDAAPSEQPARSSIPMRVLTQTPPSTDVAESVMPSLQLTRMEETAVDELVVRVDALLPPKGGRVIGFVASGRGEGTSTIATQFATSHAMQNRRRVLLLGVTRRGTAGPSVLQTVAAGEDVMAVVEKRADGVYTGNLGPAGRRHPAWSLLRRVDLWSRLRDSFDLVVLDMPSTDVSRTAFQVATVTDGVVVVVEAERTRAPVVQDLINRLVAVRGNVVGTVMNKRQFHLPERVYRWL